MGGYHLYLPNEMIETQAYLQLTMDGSFIVYGFGEPERSTRFTWREANLAKEYMSAVHKIGLNIEQI